MDIYIYQKVRRIDPSPNLVELVPDTKKAVVALRQEIKSPISWKRFVGAIGSNRHISCWLDVGVSILISYTIFIILVHLYVILQLSSQECYRIIHIHIQSYIYIHVYAYYYSLYLGGFWGG